MFLHTYVMFFVHLKYYDIEGSLWCNIFSPGRIELWSFSFIKKKEALRNKDICFLQGAAKKRIFCLSAFMQGTIG